MYETEPTTEDIATPTLDEEITHQTEGTPVGATPALSALATDEVPENLPSEAPAAEGTTPVPAEEDAPQTVPLARLQGVQRALSQAERDRDSLKDTLTTLRQELAQANARAASEYAERIKSTQRDIVPDLIRGETIEQVDASLSASRAAFAAARQAYARTIPTPQPGIPGPVGNPPAQQQSAQPTSTSAVHLISQGLRQPANDINK
jgi:hypothetical protein